MDVAADAEPTFPDLLARAQTYCATAERCPQQVRDKVQQWGGTETQVANIIQQLTDSAFLDEDRYCRAFVHDKLRFQNWGRVKLRYMLQANRLSESAIEHALRDIDPQEYADALQRVINRQRAASRRTTDLDTDRLFRHCLAHGFTYDDIRSALRDTHSGCIPNP